MEHRWGERLALQARVVLRTPGGLQGIGYIRDVSISGALVVSGMPASSMSCVHVSLPAGSSLSKSIEGQVVRQTEDGFAIEWCELAPEAVRSLLQCRVTGGESTRRRPTYTASATPPRTNVARG
jgi:hypothetical protein